MANHVRDGQSVGQMSEGPKWFVLRHEKGRERYRPLTGEAGQRRMRCCSDAGEFAGFRREQPRGLGFESGPADEGRSDGVAHRFVGIANR